MSHKVKMFFNPDCSKCRDAFDLLQESNCEIELIEYLKDVPSKEEIREVLSLLGIKAHELVRMKEEKAQEILKDKQLTDEEWIDVLHNNPGLIERPIVIYGNKAVIGRPASRVVELVKPNAF